MINYKFDKKIIRLLILILLIIVLLVFYSNIIINIFRRNRFAKQGNIIYEMNKDSVFSIEKIILCSSANAVDKSENVDLKSLSIYQYTDIAIYIKNGDELSNLNTISKLYIDNISFENDFFDANISLNYRNIMDFGLNNIIENEPEKNEEIYFNIVHTNEENNQADYYAPTFYTDCTNPITLQYVNYNIRQNYQMEPNNAISFDGSLLENAGIKIEDINCKIKFRINIINNNLEYYSCWLTIKLPLSDIYQGTTMKAKTIKENKYKFMKSLN